MSNALMFYREIAPSPEISHLVLSFWEFLTRGETPEPTDHEVFPDGCISLFFIAIKPPKPICFLSAD